MDRLHPDPHRFMLQGRLRRLVTLWRFGGLRRIADESLDGEREFWDQFHKHRFAESYVRRNRITDSTFTVEASDGGFQEFAAYLIVIAVSGGHVHVSCDSGIEISITDSERHAEEKLTPQLDAFSYESKPVLASGTGQLRAGAQCSVNHYQPEDGPEELWIDANSAGLVSLAEQCFDLGEPATPPGIELAYRPREQLRPTSMSMVLRRAQ